MTVPADQNFNNISGTLGTGSATIDGVTYFSDNPGAVLRTAAAGVGNRLIVDGTFLGFKSADGSPFSLQSFECFRNSAASRLKVIATASLSRRPRYHFLLPPRPSSL